MSDQPGFRIGEDFYPFPDNYTIGDSVLVKLVGGMDMDDFAAALQDSDERGDPRVLASLIGVAVWRQNPRWDVNRTARYVQSIDLATLSMEAGEEAVEDDAGPPDVAGSDETLLESGSVEPSAESNGTPVSVWEEPTLSPSGSPL